MDALNELKEVLTEDRSVATLGDGIYSVLTDASRKHHYDRRATVYDLIVGTRLYNSIMWGASPRDYAAFARRAITSRADGRLLDAACGSMLFTAHTYLESDRRIVAFDQSMAMLRRARRRLIDLSGSMPGHIVLLQADLSDPPFRCASFSTALCMNVLHHYEDASALVRNLNALLTDEGRLYLTSLVTNDRLVGDRYLKALNATGEFVRPRSSHELKAILDGSSSREISYRVKGNMAFATTNIPR